MARSAALFSVGDELLSGRTVNRNAAEISRFLESAGVAVVRGATLPDDRKVIAAACRAATEDVVIATGGLGPTDDDVTVEAVAKAMGRPLVEDQGQREAIDRFFRARGKEPAEVNYRQARIPRGFEVLPNDWGTAPCVWGCRTGRGRKVLVLLPGVPREMRALMEHRVLPRLKSHFKMPLRHVVEVRTVGIGESDLFQRVQGLPVPDGVKRAFLPDPGEVLLRFTGSSKSELTALAKAHAKALGSHVVGLSGDPLEAVVLDLLRKRKWTMAVAESCTGGRVASRLTGIPGSSDVFYAGLVTYANGAKRNLLGLAEKTLATHGAVSEATVREMVRGLLKRTGVQVGAAVSGIAGPGGGSVEKPVGLVWIAVGTPRGIHARRYDFKGERSDIQGRAAQECLRMVWELVRT